jgi:hypothetical protein
MSFLSEANHQSFFYNLFVLGSYFLKSAVEKSNRPGVFLSEAEKYRRAYVITRMYSFDALKCFKTGLADFKNIFRSHKTLNNATQTKCRLITNKHVLFISFSWV